MTEERVRQEFEKAAKKWFRLYVGDIPKFAAPNWTYERVAQFALEKYRQGRLDAFEEQGFLLADAEGKKFIMADYSGLGWTEDIKEALRLARRDDANKLAEIVEDAWKIITVADAIRQRREEKDANTN